MKNYSSITKVSSRRTSNRRVSTIMVVGLLLLGLFLAGSFIVRPVAEFVVTPIVYLQNWVKGSDAALPAFIRDRSALTNQIAELRQSLTEKSFSDEEISRLKTENDSLKVLLGKNNEVRIVAKVIAKPGAVPFDTMVLDKGSAHGVQEGAPVFIGNSVALGYVEKVFPESSVVILATSPGVESAVYILGPNIYATGIGQGGGVLRVGVPQGIELSEGNVVIIPSLSDAMFGEVVAIDSEPARPEQYGFVTLAEALSTVYMVSIGEKPITTRSFSEVQEIISNIQRDRLKVEVPTEFLMQNATTSTSTASSTEEVEVEEDIVSENESA